MVNIWKLSYNLPYILYSKIYVENWKIPGSSQFKAYFQLKCLKEHNGEKS